MKKIYILFGLLFLCLNFNGFGQGSESFTNLNAPGNSYDNGTFIGDNGVNWTYSNARSVTSTYNITDRTIGFSDSGTRNASCSSGSNGVGDVTYSVSRYFTGGSASDRTIEVYVNGNQYDNFTLLAEGPVYTRTFTANESGDVTIEFRSTGSRQIVIDDISWTSYSACTPPTDPIGTISGTTPACNSTTLTYTYGTGEPLTGVDYYWQTAANGTDLSNNASVTYNATTTGTYYVRAYDSGATCWSANAVSYAVTINSLPTISVQPMDQSEVIPDTATFSVTASGSPAPTYQWQVSTDNGSTWNNVTDGTGATTDTYTTASTATAMHNYQYQCVVTNTCGNVTSNAATLTLTNDSPNNATGIDECLDDNSINLTWNAPGSGATPDGYVVFARTGATDPFNITGNASDYNGFNSDFSLAPTASADLGRYVYKGNTTSATITGLTEDANYSFTVYAYVGETLTGWANGGTNGSTVTDVTAQDDATNLTATPLTNQVTLNWNNPTPTACWDQLIIVANQGTVVFTPTGDGSAYSGADNDVYGSANQLVYETTSAVSTKSITGLTNELNYCFKIFYRRGSTWSDGVEVCATPTLTYCDSYGDDTDGYLTLIRQVQFNTINNSTNDTDNDYSDFTGMSTDVTLGDSYNLTVNVHTGGNYTTYATAWIDWNQDGTFDSGSEEYDLGDADNFDNVATSNSPLTITVPVNATLGNTRMRIANRFNQSSTPCATGFDGEVEDYTINVIQPSGAEINITGGGITIPNGFNSPYGLNNTLFATTDIGNTSAGKTYTVHNIGSSALNLTGTPIVTLAGDHPGDFNVTTMPNASIAASGSSDIIIEFSPTSDGTRTAIVTISNNDTTGGEDPYTFMIEGTGNCATAVTSTITPLEGPANTEVTITSATDLTGATAALNGTAMSIVSSSASELIVQVPANTASSNIVVTFSTGCSSSNAFTVLDNIITGCEGSASSPADLFISEITDKGTGSHSYVEIYNGTGAAVDLTNYEVRVHHNGSGSASGSVSLSGTIANDAVVVVAFGGSNTNDPEGGYTADFFGNAGLGGINNNDHIRLYYNSTWVDLWGDDAGSTFTVAPQDYTYRRKNTGITAPSTTWSATDWDSTTPVDYTDIGTYDYSVGVPPTINTHPSTTSNCDLSATLSVTATEGYNGTSPADTKELTYQWYYSAPGANGWTAVPDNATFDNVTQATLTINNVLNALDYQFYCQVREDDATCYQASDAVKIDVNRTTWDGSSWDNGIPTTSLIAVIDGNYNTGANGNIDACQLVVNSSNTLNVINSTYVRIVNNVVNDGTLTVQTHGAFVQDGSGVAGSGTSGTFTNNGTARVIKSTELLNNWYEYTYWSSPVTGQTIDVAFPNTPTDRRFWFNSANYWDEYIEVNNDNSNTVVGQDDIDDNGDDWQLANGTDIMSQGVGYAATASPLGLYPGTDTATFIGAFNTGDYTTPIVVNAHAPDNDWNFIGNPYASAIDFDDVYTANSSLIDGAAFLWSHATPPNDDNNGNENINFAQADYAIITIGSGNTAGGSGVIPDTGNYIPSGQGFFVKGNASGNLTFNNSMRRADTSSNDQFFEAIDMSDIDPNKLWLNLTSDNGVFNQILVAYVNGATDNYDGWTYDAPRNLSSNLSAVIYTSIDSSDKKFAVQGKDINSISFDEVIPVGFKSTIEEPTLYTFSIAQLEGDFLSSNTVYLIDYDMNITHNLSDADYSFTSEVGEFENRFEIVFNQDTLSLNEFSASNNDLSIIELNNGNVQFKFTHNNLEMSSIEIIDVLGRTIYNLNTNSNIETYNLSNLSNATYIAKVKLSNGQIITKKAIKRL